MQVSSNCLQLIKQFEGFKPTPYFDSAGIPTIGYGTILYPDNTRVTMNDPAITEDQALEYLEFNINEKCEALDKLIKVQLSQNQYAAICSLVYNIGMTNFETSTLLRMLNQSDFDGAAAQFTRWDYSAGQVVAGLETRRQQEAKLFQS